MKSITFFVESQKEVAFFKSPQNTNLIFISNKLGGWTNELIIEYFENYAQLVFKNFASKVKVWITFDLPEQICHKHYGTDDWPPEISSSGIADYLCLRNLFLAHATVYRLYKRQFDTDNTGKIYYNFL